MVWRLKWEGRVGGGSGWREEDAGCVKETVGSACRDKGNPIVGQWAVSGVMDWSSAMFRIRILGSVHWITDPAPDPYPALFVSRFRDANKK
jgi:hypothetical protein